MMNGKNVFGVVCALFSSMTMTAQNVPQLGNATLDDVINAMTIDEKISIVTGTGDDDVPTGTTDMLAMIGSTRKIVPGAAGATHAIPRLGIPAIVMADGPAGVRIDPTRRGTDSTFYSTHFPVATLLASTWNIPLVKSVGNAMGNEALEYGVDILLAPAVNIMRNPLCGRNFEYYSEDPVLAGQMAAAMIDGIQQNGVGTSLKHFAANNQETNRTGNNAIVSRRTLHELYLKPFEIAVKESNPWTVMTSYNKLNGEYTSESQMLLDSILRKNWGYKGMVVSDWLGGQDAVRQMKAGNDLLMPGLAKQRKAIKEAIEQGELSESVLDKNVKRILALVMQTPRFHKYQYSNAPDLQSHGQIAHMSATEGMVLLKNNEKTLPLNPNTEKNIALFGISSYDFISGGKGSGDVNSAYTISLAEGLQSVGMSVDDTLRNAYLSYIEEESAKLPPATMEHPVSRVSEMPVPESVINGLAHSQNAAIITIGRLSSEGIDRNKYDDFMLSDTEAVLMKNVCSAFHRQGKKVIVVLNVCGVVDTDSWKEMPDAILVSWLAGQEGGNAVSDILIGANNPSGRLPMSWPLSYEDVPSSGNFPQTGSTENVDNTEYKEGLMVGYRYYDTQNKSVSYPFGFGLSYTTFKYANPNISLKGDTLTVQVDVRNSGKVAGKEVVQVYVSAPGMDMEKPAKELKGFAKTNILQGDETETVTINIPVKSLASFDETTDNWKLENGTYQVHIASDVENVQYSIAIEISEESI